MYAIKPSCIQNPYRFAFEHGFSQIFFQNTSIKWIKTLTKTKWFLFDHEWFFPWIKLFQLLFDINWYMTLYLELTKVSGISAVLTTSYRTATYTLKAVRPVPSFPRNCPNKTSTSSATRMIYSISPSMMRSSRVSRKARKLVRQLLVQHVS